MRINKLEIVKSPFLENKYIVKVEIEDHKIKYFCADSLAGDFYWSSYLNDVREFDSIDEALEIVGPMWNIPYLKEYLEK